MKQQIELERKEWGTIAKCHTVRGGGIEVDTKWDQSLSEVKSIFLRLFHEMFSQITQYLKKAVLYKHRDAKIEVTSFLSLLKLVTCKGGPRGSGGTRGLGEPGGLEGLWRPWGPWIWEDREDHRSTGFTSKVTLDQWSTGKILRILSGILACPSKGHGIKVRML